MAVLFWVSGLLFIYAYVAFPALLAIALRLAKASAKVESPAELPEVAVVLSALNEETHIADRVANLLSQDYPADKLRIYVGSDGSEDGTSEILESLRSSRVQAQIFTRRRGKASVLNDLVSSVSAPIVVFTDANVTFDRAAVRTLVHALAAEKVGAACGELVLRGNGTENQDSVYWRAERFLKAAEGKLGALLGANGAIYAIRRDLYQPLPTDTITDDFVIAMRIAASGWQLVYEPAARAWEDTPQKMDDEFRRRIRIGLGNYQALFRYPEFLLRTSPIRAWAYFSHKILRWFGPHLLLVNFIALFFVAPRGNFYGTIFALQVIGYSSLLITAWVRRYWRPPRILLGLVLFAGLNVAFAWAFLKYLFGSTSGQWSRTERVAQ